MIEILTVVLFCWLCFRAVKLTFKITWGVAKVLAVILFVISLPTLIGCLLFASGVILLIPLAIIALAWGILRICV